MEWYYTYSGLANAITAMSIGIFVLLKGRKQSVKRIFFFMMLAVVVWSYGYYMWQSSSSSEEAFFWIRIFMFGAIFIPFTFLHFVVHFVERNEEYFRMVFTGYAIAFITSVINWTPYFIASITPKLVFDYWPNPGVLFHPFLVVWVLYAGTGVWLLSKAYTLSTGIQRSHVKYVLFGSVVGFIGGATNYLLWYDILVPPFGNITAMFFSITVGYAIVRHRLFDAQIRSQQILNVLIPIIVTLIISYSISYYALYDLGIPARYVGGSVLIIGIVAYEIMRRIFVYTQLGSVLLHQPYRYRTSLEQLASDALGIIDLDVLLQRVMDVLTEDMSIQRVAILMRSSDHPQNFEILRSEKYTDLTLKPLMQPTEKVLSILNDENNSYVKDEISFLLERELPLSQQQDLHTVQHLLETTDAQMILRLQVQQNLVGYIVIGDRENHRIYSAEDIALLERVSHQLAIAFVNSKLHHETERRAKILQREVDHAVDAWKQKSHENEELSMLRSQFISVMSHQLRTPISVIRNSLELVTEDYLSVAQQEDTHISSEQMKHIVGLLNNAYLASDNLKNITESILASSEFIGTVPGLQIKRIETKKFFDYRVERVQRILEAKAQQGIQLNIEIGNTIPSRFVTDEKKLALILDNLLANAALYTTAGSVSFSVHTDDGFFVIEIADTGIGIPEDEQDKVFQRFMRLHNAQRVVPDGSGLGLYLAKSYIELLRGEIAFESTEGEGTTFTLHIPIEYRYIAT